MASTMSSESTAIVSQGADEGSPASSRKSAKGADAKHRSSGGAKSKTSAGKAKKGTLQQTKIDFTKSKTRNEAPNKKRKREQPDEVTEAEDSESKPTEIVLPELEPGFGDAGEEERPEPEVKIEAKVVTMTAEEADEIEKVLRAFDLDPTFGPCVGITRMERWDRAVALGLDPPGRVRDLLTENTSFAFPLWHGQAF
ncbi:DNA polymerase delta, subunit 4-domain-containing protein [Hyaloraphidium curvatum]|nr:DNA polymerase delta, subunit 4-domain-containing protein [Hyaloraphidium curvatum]